MTLHSLLQHAHWRASQAARIAAAVFAQTAHRVGPATVRAGVAAREGIRRSPVRSAAMLVLAGVTVGAFGHDVLRGAELDRLRADAEQQRNGLEATRREAQREVNALAARLGELQAQANRLNALGERLTRIAQLGDGEFDFEKPVGVGGAGQVSDMPPGQLRGGMGVVGAQLKSSGDQLSVLESLLFNRELDRSAMPSRSPIADSYITSGFGTRADPFGGGHQFHKGIDYEANHGDPVLAVADGVVTYSSARSGYGNTVEIDHGNGYVTRYAHNSRNLAQVGDLVRGGQRIALAGSTGRSTGTHVHLEVWENGVVVNPSQFLAPAHPATAPPAAPAPGRG
jgi:murein DD-endopeptidase MepM/ murein hydrolase activator NlpD